jgi:hypothetical protein
LPGEIRGGIEKLAHPLFMPRNEEEVMRNIITLSNQLKLFHDLPQVILNFEGQTETGLLFTVIWVRVLKESDLSLSQVFESKATFLHFEPDRIRRIGLLRKKYPREATVFRICVPAQNFLRSDHSVDLFKARFAIVQELQRVLGEFRDFNGGMIAKQHEQFLRLKCLFSRLDGNDEMLLENFFHSIYPVELRSLFNPVYLKKIFILLLEAVKKNRESPPHSGISHLLDDACCYVLLTCSDPELKEVVMEGVRELQIPASQLLIVNLQEADNNYLGYICFEESSGRRQDFLNAVILRGSHFLRFPLA